MKQCRACATLFVFSTVNGIDFDWITSPGGGIKNLSSIVKFSLFLIPFPINVLFFLNLSDQKMLLNIYNKLFLIRADDFSP